MKKVPYVLMAMFLINAPAVFAQQEVTQTTTTTSTVPIQPAPITMTLPENTDPWQVSVQGGGLWAQKDARLHDGSEILGRLTYDITPNVAVGGESGGMRFVDKIDGTTFGRLYGVPAMADVVLKMPIAVTGNRLVPYVYGGAGLIVWSYSTSGTSDDTGLDARTRTHFAAKPGWGIEYYVTPHVAVFLEGSYLFSERFDLKGAAGTPPDGKVNVDSIYGGGGLKVAF